MLRNTLSSAKFINETGEKWNGYEYDDNDDNDGNDYGIKMNRNTNSTVKDKFRMKWHAKKKKKWVE